MLGRHLIAAIVEFFDPHAENLPVIAGWDAVGFYQACGFAGAGMTTKMFGRAVLMFKQSVSKP